MQNREKAFASLSRNTKEKKEKKKTKNKGNCKVLCVTRKINKNIEKLENIFNRWSIVVIWVFSKYLVQYSKNDFENIKEKHMRYSNMENDFVG